MERNTYRWLLALRGVTAIVFGVLAVVWPRVTVLALALLFGAYALVDGGFTLTGLIRAREVGQWFAHLLAGLLGVTIGVLTLLWPAITALVLVVMIGAWAVLTGLLDVWAAARLRGQRLLAVVGVLSVIAGVIVLIRPDVGAIAIARVIGVYAIVIGVLMLAGVRMVHRAPPAPAGRAAPIGV
jgi:uncharacterized membrane protein HdeD (DUF308 family)